MSITFWLRAGMVASSAIFLIAFFRHWFKRDWKLINQQEIPSPFEQAAKVMKSMSFKEAPDWFYRKAIVYTYQCQLTKRIKVIKEYNP